MLQRHMHNSRRRFKLLEKPVTLNASRPRPAAKETIDTNKEVDESAVSSFAFNPQPTLQVTISDSSPPKHCEILKKDKIL